MMETKKSIVATSSKSNLDESEERGSSSDEVPSIIQLCNFYFAFYQIFLDFLTKNCLGGGGGARARA